MEKDKREAGRVTQPIPLRGTEGDVSEASPEPYKLQRTSSIEDVSYHVYETNWSGFFIISLSKDRNGARNTTRFSMLKEFIVLRVDHVHNTMSNPKHCGIVLRIISSYFNSDFLSRARKLVFYFCINLIKYSSLHSNLNFSRKQ